MKHTLLCALALFAGCFPVSTARADDEACVACNRSVWVSGDFKHGWVHGPVVIEGAPSGLAQAFRESLYGPHFTVTVSNLPPGKYVARIGMVEVAHTNENVFDITCGQTVIASNLDLFATVGAAKVYFVTGQVEQASDAIGSLAFDFVARIGDAELNTFELHDASGTSLVSLRASDLLPVENADALKPPVVEGPVLWRDPSLPMTIRVNDLIRRMSLAEKVQQLRNDAPAIPRLGSARLQLLE